MMCREEEKGKHQKKESTKEMYDDDDDGTAGSCLRPIDFVYLSAIGLGVIKKEMMEWHLARCGQLLGVRPASAFAISGFGFRAS